MKRYTLPLILTLVAIGAGVFVYRHYQPQPIATPTKDEKLRPTQNASRAAPEQQAAAPSSAATGPQKNKISSVVIDEQKKRIAIPKSALLNLVRMMAVDAEEEQLSQEKVVALAQEARRVLADHAWFKEQFQKLPPHVQAYVLQQTALKEGEHMRNAVQEYRQNQIMKENLEKDIERAKMELLKDRECIIQIVFVGGSNSQRNAQHLESSAINVAQQGSSVARFLQNYKESTNTIYDYRQKNILLSELEEFIGQFQGDAQAIKDFVTAAKEDKSGRILLVRQTHKGKVQYALLHLAYIAPITPARVKTWEDVLKTSVAYKKASAMIKEELSKYRIEVTKD